MELTIRAAAPDELCWRGISACWVSPVAISYTMGTMMLMGSCGPGILWVNWSCKQHMINSSLKSQWLQSQGKTQALVHHLIPHNDWWSWMASILVKIAKYQFTYKEQHFGLEYDSDGSWWGNGRSAGWDSQTKLHIPIQLSSLVWELKEKCWIGYISKSMFAAHINKQTNKHRCAYQLQLHNSNTVSEYIGRSPQQLCEGI